MKHKLEFKIKNLQLKRGFTLVELMVVIAILGTLLALTFSMLNPGTQLNRVSDGKRKEELTAIKQALEIYYNDNNCYPTSIPFGAQWVENGAVYMQKVPQDPNCSADASSCYIYQYSGSCPQWVVLFAKLSKDDTSACSLSALSGCIPSDFTSKWFCATSGNVDCAYLAGTQLSSGSVITSPTPTQDPQATSTPTPTPSPTPACAPSEMIYTCAGIPAQCNVAPEGSGQYCTPACGGAC